MLFSAAANADALLVTLHKSESDYSPTTMYQDYAISQDLFHWESQSGTTVASPTGQRYLRHRETGSHVLLFSRTRKVSAFGTGAPYLFLGEADYVEHRGERPIAITWRLRVPCPPPTSPLPASSSSPVQWPLALTRSLGRARASPRSRVVHCGHGVPCPLR